MLRILSTGSAATAAILMMTFVTTTASAAGSPLGVWLDDKGRGAIEISKCGGALCGKVVWVKFDRDKKGCGVKILGGVKPAGSGSWDYGWIYSPDHGRKFDVALTPVGGNRLRVFGYAGIKLFGESRTWTRAPADLQRCDKAETATTPPPAQAAPAQIAKADANATAETPTAAAPSPPPNTTTTPAPEPDTASANPADGTSPEAAPRGSDGLSFEKLLKKTADGRCKLDLPWLKVDFNCKDI